MTSSKLLPLVSLPGLTVWADYGGDGRTVKVEYGSEPRKIGWTRQPTAQYGNAIREQARRDADERMQKKGNL